MKTSTSLKTTLALAAVMMAGLLPASADIIPIPNPGFEQLQQADAQDNYNQFAATKDVWRQWLRTENGGPLRVWNPGASGVTFQGVLGYGFGGTAPEGNMVQIIYSRYSDVTIPTVFSQTDGANYFEASCQLLDGTTPTTAAPFDNTKVYTLTATVGKPPVFVTNSGPQFVTDARRPQSTVWFGYSLQLAVGGANVSGASFGGYLTGGTIVAQDCNARVVPVDGYRTVTTTYFPNPADAALAGQFLQLRLASLDNPADLKMTGYVVYDDVKLNGFAAPTPAYWDLNGTTAGAGGATPSGIWDGANTFWNAVAGGTGSTAAWTGGQKAVFAAGTDASGPYTVTVSGTQDIGGLAFEGGNVTLTGGTALRLTGIAMVDVTNGLTATVATPITEATSGLQLAKTGAGTLVLSGANTYTGGSTVLGGTLRLGASNVLDDASPVTISGWSAGTTTLDLAGNSDTIGGLILGGTTTNSAASVTTGAGTLTLGGDVSYVNAMGTGINPLGATISGQLDLGAAARTFLVNDSATAADDLTVSANITGSVALSKTGKGVLVLSGNNAGANGGLSLQEGTTRVESAAALNGTARNVTVATPGSVVFGSSFGAGNIPTALANRIMTTSDGIIAADNFAGTSFDFNAAGLTNAYLGAVGNVTYTGTLTPGGTAYRLGGGGGTLTMANANALTGGGNSLSVGGKLTLSAANSYGGGTVLLGGTVFPAGPVVLTLGADGALGSGPLTFQAQPNATTDGIIQSADSSARTLANRIVLNGGLNTGGTGNLNFTDTTPINLSSIVLFVITNPVTSFAQAFTGTGGITMDYTGPGTVIMAGNNSYTNATLINGGTLVLTGNNSAATGGFSLSSRFNIPTGVVFGNDNALGSGTTFTIAAVPATVAAQGTRTIANAIAASADFSIVGTDPLTLAGTMTLSANRSITNNNTTSTTTLGPITGAAKTLTFWGDGNTAVTGAITTTTGTLTKNGAGKLTLSGANTYTGVTTVNTGTLALSGSGSIASTSLINVTNSATFDVTAASSFTLGSNQRLNGLGNVIGAMTVNGTISTGPSVGTLTSGSQTWNGGGTNIFALSSATNSAGMDRLNLNGTLNVQSSAGTPFTIRLVSMADNVTPGVVPDFDPNASYSWVIATASGGILNFDPSKFVVNTSAFSNPVQWPFTVAVQQGTNLVVNYTAPPVFHWTGLQSSEWSTNVIGGSKNWTLLGSPSDYTDGLAVQFAGVPGTSTVDLSVANVTPTGVSFDTSATNYTLQGSKGIAGATGLTKLGTGTLTLLNTNTYTGGTTLSVGTLQLGDGTSGHDGTIANSQAVTNNGALVFNRFGNSTYSGVISGSGTVTKTGPGTLMLTNANTYTGLTTVSNGLLYISTAEQLQSQNFAVKDGAGLGVLNLGGSQQALISGLTLGNSSGGSTLAFSNVANPGTAMFIAYDPGVTLNGNCTIKIADKVNLVAGNQYPLFLTTAITTNSGTGFSLSLPAGVQGNLVSLASPAGIALNVTAIIPINTNPPPLHPVLNGAQFSLSWPTNAGWILQTQTNSVGNGLGTNWVDVAGSDTVTGVTNTINPASGSVFYRLRLP